MPKPARSPSDPSRAPSSSAALARASLIRFTAILTLVFVSAGSLLLYFADNLDRTEERHTRFLIEKAIDASSKALKVTIKDYAFWGDAYRHLHTTVDVDWAYVRQNVGPTLYEDFGFDAVFVIGPADRTRYAVVEGRLETASATQWLGQPITDLLRDARANTEETAVMLSTNHSGLPTLIAAAALTPGTDPTAPTDDGPASVLLFSQVLDPARLDELGKNFGIRHLHLATGSEATEPAYLLHGNQGPAGTLVWTPETPGRQMLTFVLPLIALAALTVFLMTWIMLRRTATAARSLDASYASLQRSQAALAVSEARFRDVAEASSDWIWEVDAHGRLTYLSERFEAITALRLDNWLGRPVDDLLHPESDGLLGYLQNEQLQPNAPVQCTYADAQGRQRVARVSARDSNGLGFRGTATDITVEVDARRRVEYLSRHDVLTGLPNRANLREFLTGKLLNAPAQSQPLVMLNIDLDRFKPVNDLLGHAMGDEVLHQVSRRLNECVRSGDLVARVGGDEFVMILCSMSEHSEIEALCQRLIDSIEQRISIDNQDIFISASIGIAMAPNDATQAAELLRYSDIALYEAKASGRGTWRFYACDMNARIIERRRLESDLRYAIAHGELRLHFQPRFRIEDGQMVGAEALVRWQHPQRGLIAPDTFIPIAEDSGLIVALSDWVLQAACHQAASWPAQLFVSVNLSSKEFQSAHLPERVAAALTSTGLAATRLELELTESVMLDDADNALAIMLSLKALGVRLSIDDFGTGYSSLGYLRAFPFDGLKIDRSFVDRLGEGPGDLAIIEAIIGLGRALSLTVTAEGIETAEHLQLLRSAACDEGQGYHLGRPLDVAGFNRLLTDRALDTSG